MKESYINEQLLNENLIIDPKDLKDDIEIIVRDKLKGQVEGICFKDGYVIPGSVKVIKRKLGKINTTDNKSGIVYNIEYKAKVIAKIESLEGVSKLEEIVEETDGILIDRGDLSREISLKFIPLVQESLINTTLKKYTGTHDFQ